MAEISYRRHRFPPVIIQHAVWVYLRFTLSYRDVEELLAERGLDISYETVRCWVLKFTDLELVPHGSLLTPRWRRMDSNFRVRRRMTSVPSLRALSISLKLFGFRRRTCRPWGPRFRI